MSMTFRQYDNWAELGVSVFRANQSKLDMTVVRDHPDQPASLCVALYTPEALTDEPVQELVFSVAEACQLRTWLRDLDGRGILAADPVFFPPIKNAIRSDGSRLPETFGTIRVLHDSCYADVAEWQLCSDGSLAIDRYITGQYMELSQAEVQLLLQALDECSVQGVLSSPEHLS